ncbi:hypothetical protein [Syntrophobacter fumaroxidans]|uniref:Uncharacterized protein n=1 Tax=Syntrophobacter fumaroxidans (strain DSM 10017 / MPOB) TaxID=335543 RepID=A0LPD9_SYNFM|nr:hypothetical protein [Syntrophobacter fumaroxidans]ABK19291.1 hypothetical protein Sfum_3621 [Syntrophobacter fumaroxidans MPOB]
MSLYDVFFSIALLFDRLRIRYAVIGGIALAFHAVPRFTRDIDVLVPGDDMDLLRTAMDELGFEETAEPRKLDNSTLTLHRSLKIEGEDGIMVDTLVADSEEQYRIIRDADHAESRIGTVSIAARLDLVWLRRSRNSPRDRVDILELEKNDEDRGSSQER